LGCGNMINETKECIVLMIMCLCGIGFAISIPTSIWGGIIYVFDLNNKQIFGGTIGILTFWCIGMILLELKWSKQRRLMWKRHISNFSKRKET